MKKYWYKFHTLMCPVCGHEKTEKYRVEGERPADYLDRHTVTEYYDYCNE